jgi:TRAP-type C4-dicarboxylate transport system permease small subunit
MNRNAPAAGSVLGRLHDAVTKIGFALAGACLVGIVIAYTYEVGARYFFNSPTTWASSLVSYLLCAIVFLAMPEVTRDRVHIFIGVFLDDMDPKAAAKVQLTTYVVAALACFFAAYFCFSTTLGQFKSGISTVNEWRIPKWALSVLIPYGLFSSGIYFVRQVLSKVPYKSAEVM